MELFRTAPAIIRFVSGFVHCCEWQWQSLRRECRRLLLTIEWECNSQTRGRKQQLVFIGSNTDKEALRAKLNACLLDEAVSLKDNLTRKARLNPFPLQQMTAESANVAWLASCETLEALSYL